MKAESGSHTNRMHFPPGLATLIDSIPALVAYIDCNMVLHYCNQPFKSRFCIHDESDHKPFQPVVGKEIFDQIQRHMGRVLVGERAHFQISDHYDSDFHCHDATLTPDFDARGRVRGFIFHSSDITEKARTERTLKDYFENAAIGLHWVDADGIIKWANAAELRMLGYTEKEYVGRHIADFYVNKNHIEEILQRLASKQKITNYETDLKCKDGSIKHVNINSSVLWEGEKFIHTRCFTIDITEQKRAAKAVQESEQRFKMMAALAPLVIWTADQNGNCNFVNNKWAELTGRTCGGSGVLWADVIHPDDKANISTAWSKAFSSQKVYEAKFRIVSREGGYHVAYVNSTPWYTSAGDFDGYIGILQNISSEENLRYSLEKIVLHRTEDLRKRNADLKKAERLLQEKNQELEATNRHLSSFAHVASHDLQEPLRKIQTFANMIFDEEGLNFSDKSKGLYLRLKKSSERMRTLIHDLLEYSRSQGNASQLEEVDLNILFDELTDELEIAIKEKDARIDNFGLPTVNVVRFQFHQLFLNLLSNALKFSRPDVAPHIVVQSEVVDAPEVLNDAQVSGKKYHHITFSDNGIGFDPKFSEKLFEMFQRLHPRDQYEGTGIGLAICKKIIENHQGIIIAESEPGLGATFHLYLPVEVVQGDNLML